MYKVKLETNGQEYRSQGETMLEALENIPLDWQKVKMKGKIYFSNGKVMGERLLYMKLLKMLLVNKLRRVGLAKQFEAILKYQNED